MVQKINFKLCVFFERKIKLKKFKFFQKQKKTEKVEAEKLLLNNKKIFFVFVATQISKCACNSDFKILYIFNKI